METAKNSKDTGWFVITTKQDERIVLKKIKEARNLALAITNIIANEPSFRKAMYYEHMIQVFTDYKEAARMEFEEWNKNNRFKRNK